MSSHLMLQYTLRIILGIVKENTALSFIKLEGAFVILRSNFHKAEQLLLDLFVGICLYHDFTQRLVFVFLRLFISCLELL